MFKMKCSVLAVALLFSTMSLAEEPATNEAESKNCTAQIAACATLVGSSAVAVSAALKECKPLRQCKKDCRVVKRACKKDERQDKRSCKDDCRNTHGHGKEYRDCAKSCREAKRDGADECREDKKECKEGEGGCFDNFKTPACTTARKAVLGSTFGAGGACAQAAACINSNSK